MKEAFLKIANDLIFVRHSEFVPGNRTALFVHGLGESGLCFQEAFTYLDLLRWNIIVPDLVGYGRSSEASDYSFDSHLVRLRRVLDWAFEQECSNRNIALVGHSMGADLATLLCADPSGINFRDIVNVEGDITDCDLFISGEAVRAESEGRFTSWFRDDFCRRMIYQDLGPRYESVRRYHASLMFARPQAFLENARELYSRATTAEPPYQNEFGKLYCRLKLRKLFCWGDQSLSAESRLFLDQMGLANRRFEGAFHWPMIDRTAEFYPVIDTFFSDSY